ncbi:MAG: hypothetical protein HY548_00580 [Elusimicrobia bacterium]|nr:hypothetical protein [Elusimicrobiota bacterium]
MLVHRDAASAFLPRMVKKFAEAKVEIRGDPEVKKLGGPAVQPAVPEDWDTEFLGLTVAARMVSSLDEAIEHINRHGSHHSDSIVTQDAGVADRFLRQVDSAAVFHNASTRLHDGSIFGLGAEMGISTQKMHARGTMGLKELTTTKFVVHGTGQVRE